MKNTYKWFILGISILIVVGFAFYSQTTQWDDLKLRMTRFWGFFTIKNNPLLSSQDDDLKAIEDKDDNARIDLKLLLSGGPPKDGIPSIDNPKFDSTEDTPYKDNDTVIGVFLNGEARAYPYGIMNWHEIVNDEINGTPISVTLCPLCDTNPTFIRRVNGQETTFGVSGKLYQSCLVMYDRLTDSLWAQPWGLAVAGEEVNESLEKIPSVKTTLGNWKNKYPNTKVLSTDTGHQRSYFESPYGSYETNDTLIFPVRNQDSLDIHPKEIVSYIWQPDNKTPNNKFSGDSVHYTHVELRDKREVEFEYNNEKVSAIWDEDLETIRFYLNNDEEIPSSTAFGFVYPAFFE